MVVVAGVLAFQVLSAASALTAARSRAHTLADQLRAGDLAGARTTAAALRDDADRARHRTGGPLWWAAERVPGVGPTFEAVQVAARSVDLVARRAVPAATRVGSALQRGALRPHRGALALQPIETLGPVVGGAARALDTADARLAAVDPGALLGPVQSTFADLQAQVASARGAADTAATTLRVLPGMLGAHGPRSWLLLVQNNAEIRATGGMAGSWAVLRTDHGHIRMVRQGADTDMPPLKHPVVPLPQSVQGLYGDDLGTDFRDMNFDPDFPQVARMAAALLRHDHGARVDGVIAVDPVALAHVLDATGPVHVAFAGHRASLTGDNVVDVLLNRVYRTIPDGALQNAFFEAAARAVFRGVTRGQADPRALTHGLATAAGSGRILVWSRHAEEQQALEHTPVAGALPDGAGGVPQVGVYLDDATATKMEYYLRVRARVHATGCSATGVQQLRSRVVLRSAAPPDAARLSPYVTGPGTYARRGSMRVNAWLYGPTGGDISAVRVDGRPVTVTADRQAGRQVTTVPALLRPGQRVVVTARMRSGPGQAGDPVLTSTPTAEERPNRVTAASACAG